MKLRPFWRYYGGKWRAAPRYPTPTQPHIIEPFAGSAGYALRFADRNVTLVERYAPIAELWRWLTAVSASEVRRIPLVTCVDDLPAWVSAGARVLVGFQMNAATTHPCRTMSAGIRKARATGHDVNAGWSDATRERVATQVEYIRHWRVIEGDFTLAPDTRATWFIDPPYNNRPGARYPHQVADYTKLGAWCRTRRGQVIVCENVGATWLPFVPFATFKAGVNNTRGGSQEAIWTAAAPADD